VLQTNAADTHDAVDANLRQPRFPSVGVMAFVPDRWDAIGSSRSHVLTRLARYFRVLWIEPARGWRTALRPPSASGPDGSVRPTGFDVYAPEAWLPRVGRPRWLGVATHRLRVRRARDRLARRGCERFVLYLWRPEYGSVLSAIPHDLSCYHIDDEYSFSRTDQPIDDDERQLLRQVDQVIVHSPALLEKKGSLNPSTTLVPNGVDYRAHATPAPEPSDLRGVPRPRIGYTGRVKRQLDWPLIEELVLRHENWNFVFVGAHAPHEEVHEVVARLSRRSNLSFLGAKSVEELAVYPQHFDVCIMPYRIDDYTKYIYPMKLHEFLASGRPTVGTAIRSLEEFKDVIALPETPAEWTKAICGALTPEAQSSERVAARRAVARRHDWDRLVARIARAMGRGLGLDIDS